MKTAFIQNFISPPTMRNTFYTTSYFSGGLIKFFGLPFSPILLRKIGENGSPKKYFLAAQAANTQPTEKLDYVAAGGAI